MVLGKLVTIGAIPDLNFNRWLSWWPRSCCYGGRLEICNPSAVIPEREDTCLDQGNCGSTGKGV